MEYEDMLRMEENGDESEPTGATGGVPLEPTSENIERSQRERRPTDKWRLFTLNEMSKQLSNKFGKLMSDSDTITQMMANNANKLDLTEKYKDWLGLYEQYLQLRDEYNILMGDEESHIEILQTRDLYLRNFKSKVENYFMSQKSDSLDGFVQTSNNDDNASTKKSNSRRTGSVRSHSSSNISAARLKEEHKKAELCAKMASLTQRQNIELEKQKLKFQEEQLDLSTEIAVSNAKSKVLERYENVDICNTIDVSTRIDTNADFMHDAGFKMPHIGTDLSMLNPYVQPFIPGTNIGNMHETNQNCKTKHDQNLPDRPMQNSTAHPVNIPSNNVMLNVVHHLSKPSPEINKIDGNPREYRKFLRQFRAKIESNTDSSDERMNYLEQFTLGEAHKVVSGYSHLDGNIGYPAALRELEDRYGDHEIMASAFINAALDWPQLKPGDAKALDDFSLYLTECMNAVECIGALKILEYPDNMRKLVAKLPVYLHDRWRNIVLSTKAKNQPITFKHLVDLVRLEAKKANDPLYGRNALVYETKEKFIKRPTGNRPKGAFATTIEASETDSKQSFEKRSLGPKSNNTYTHVCTYCNNSSHELTACKKFDNLSIEDRYTHLKLKGHCFGCLKRGHMKSECKRKSRCSICDRYHPTVLHDVKISYKLEPSHQIENVKPAKDVTTIACVNETTSPHDNTDTGDVTCSMAIIPVRVKLSNKAQSVLTYAFFDSGSSASFCTESLLNRLGGQGKKMHVTLTTMGEPYKMETYAVTGLQVCDVDNLNTVSLPRVYTKKCMPVSHHHIPRQEDLNSWSHLEDIKIPDIHAEIGLMIGNNVPDAYSPVEVRTGARGSPHATKTLVGWIIWNLVHSDRDQPGSISRSDLLVNRAEISALQNLEDARRLEMLVQRSYDFDFPEKNIDDKPEPSREDKMFLKQVGDSIKFQDGHYCIDLPFRNQDCHLPNNIKQAKQRLVSLQSKLIKNAKFKRDYIGFMDKLFVNGYAERVADSDLHRDDGRIWFLPHHGVYHPRKPEKIRVVFDCSASCMGVSLNSQLLSGPDLTNGLIGVLLRFREEKVAVTGDIEAMFYQVNVPAKDADCLRFLWWPGGDLDLEPVQYRMVVHLFGANSSPSCCNYALKRTAQDNKADFSPDVVQLLNKNMYVDDCLASAPNEETASFYIENLTDLCARGGFRLTKWMSSSSPVLSTVPEDERAKGVRELDLNGNNLPSDSALGVYWITVSDSLGFKIQLPDRPATRRGILATVSSIFDPLGLAAPFVLSAKSLLQELCKQKLTWDEELNKTDLKHWSEWAKQIPNLESISVNRCYKPDYFTEVASCQLHVFTDASETGYGIAIYLRLMDTEGHIHCSLVMGKSRVAPLKQITIPRMELTAAVMGVRLTSIVLRELTYPIDETFFWTDSMSVLRYIQNRTCRFHTFVANRLAVIHESTYEHQWRYIQSKLNPADLASRGSRADALTQHSCWLNGPNFLSKSEIDWPETKNGNMTISNDDVEVKVLANATTLSSEVQTIDRLINNCSTWMKLKRITAWILMGFDNLKRRIKLKKDIRQILQKSEPETGKLKQKVHDAMLKTNNDIIKRSQTDVHSTRLTLDYIGKAEMALIRYTRQSFGENLQESGHSRQKLKKGSPLYKLDPFLKNGIIRVGGRLERAELPYDTRHQIILPKNSRISELILEETHRKIGHLGKLSILSNVRQKFWIIGATLAIKRLTSNCVTCRKYQGSQGKQKMASLPKERLSSDEAPFTHVGMDFFGPFYVKRNRTTVKRYGVIFYLHVDTRRTS